MISKPPHLQEAERDLVALYQDLCPVGGDCPWDQPFLAGCGPKYSNAKVRLLFVGKATAGWSDVNDPTNRDSIAAASTEFLLNPREYAFFRYLRAMSNLVANCHPIANPLELIAYTNIARIGYGKANPNAVQFKMQASVCWNLLSGEIDWLQPDVILLLTGNYQHRFISDFFLELLGTKFQVGAAKIHGIASGMAV